MWALRDRLLAFLFPRETDHWLAVLRIGLGVQTLAYAISLRKDWEFLFAGTGHGLISRDLAEAILSLETNFVPRLGWFIELGAKLGISESTSLYVVWICLVGAGCGLVAGVLSRFSAILAWLIHLAAAKSGSFLSYGADNFMTIGLFYLMLSPLPDAYTLDRRRRARLVNRQPGDSHPRSENLGFWRRVLQLHLCLIYFFGGLAKCLGSGWWNGVNLWRALTRPPFDVIPAEILVVGKYFFPILGISVWIIEIGYPVFVWIKATRNAWLFCVIVMHAVIGLAMGMYLFSLVMIVLNIAAFGPGFVFGRNNQTELARGGTPRASPAPEMV